MISRHLNDVMGRLESICDRGHGEISKYELARWYGFERKTKKIWKDLQDKWEEVSDGSELMVGDTNDGWVLIYGRGLRGSDNSWFKDIRYSSDAAFKGDIRDFNNAGDKLTSE